jgi:hypothetical protein
MVELWMCGRVNLICREGRLGLEDADTSPGIPMNVGYFGGREGDDYEFERVMIADDFDAERVELEGEARNQAIAILRIKATAWSNFCEAADWEQIGAV